MSLVALLVFFLPAGILAQEDRDARVARARQHVEAQEFDAALTIFRQLAGQNPRDFEARVWVARLVSWKGEHAQAEQLYREVLREDPENFEAELGLVDVLSWQKRYPEAEDRLRALRAKYPKDLEVVQRQAKLARWQHQRQEAIAYYEELLALDPANAEANEILPLLRSETNYRLDVGYLLEEYDFIRNTHGGFVSLLYHDNDRLWLVGGFQYQNKFFQNNTRYTAGATYRFWERTYARGEVTWAPAHDTVVPNQDYTAELIQGLRRGLNVGGSYRYLRFDQAHVHVLTALVDADPHPKLHWTIRYMPARTLFKGTGAKVWNQGGWTRLTWDAHRNLSPYALFAVGAENFSTADRLGRFSAQTYGVGTEVRFTPKHGMNLGYYYQNRTLGRREQGFRGSYFVRF